MLTMQVGSWGELQSVVKSGAMSVEQAIGLKEGEVNTTLSSPTSIILEHRLLVFPCKLKLQTNPGTKKPKLS